MTDKIFKGIFTVFIVMLGLLYLGWVVTDMWNWFIHPLGVDKINIPIAIGISLTFQLMKGIGLPPAYIDEKMLTFQVLFLPIIIWCVGYVIYNHYIIDTIVKTSGISQ